MNTQTEEEAPRYADTLEAAAKALGVKPWTLKNRLRYEDAPLKTADGWLLPSLEALLACKPKDTEDLLTAAQDAALSLFFGLGALYGHKDHMPPDLRAHWEACVPLVDLTLKEKS
jgi:hypothetical protein